MFGIRIIREPEIILKELEDNRPYDKQWNGEGKLYFAYPKTVRDLINYIKANKIIIIIP